MGRVTLCRTDGQTFEPTTAVVTVFLEAKIFVLVVDTNLGLSVEVVCHSCKACTPKSILDAQIPVVPVAIVCQFLDGMRSGLYRMFQWIDIVTGTQDAHLDSKHEYVHPPHRHRAPKHHIQ